MTRLDRHVAAVRNKLAVARFWDSFAFAGAVFAGGAVLVVLVYKFFHIAPPAPSMWLMGAALASLVAAIVVAIVKRPTAHEAAVAIDERLGLKEKFSTALAVRRMSNDEFAQAAVKDAEATAQQVALDSSRYFPMRYPRAASAAIGLAIAALLAYWLIPNMDLFGREERAHKIAIEQQKQENAKKTIEKALATVNSVPKDLASEEAVKLAKRDLEEMLKQPITDPQKAQRTALKTLQDVTEAAKQQIKDNQKFADAQNDQKMFKNLIPPSDESGPVSDVRRDLAKGDFAEATKKLDDIVKKFDKMSEEEKQKAADQMKQMEQQLKQMANDPKVQQQMQQQLQQQAGMSQQQAQQMVQQMQQAAQGNQAAQQQLQQQMQQAMQNATPQQQQAIQQAMKQAQAQANAQQQAGQMQQGAQQMAQAMQQAAQQGQQGQQGQQQGQGQQQQQMAQGAQMQQQMQQMDAIQKDAQQMAAAQQAAQQGAQDAADQMNGNGGQGGESKDGQQQQGNGKGQDGQWAQGDPKKGQGNGMGGPGQGNGGRAKSDQAPFGTKQEFSPSQDNDSGKVLASTLVKANSLKGDSKQQVREVVAAAEQEATDEVDQERISHQAREVVKGYFGSLEKDAK